MLKALAWPRSFTKKGGFGLELYLEKTKQNVILKWTPTKYHVDRTFPTFNIQILERDNKVQFHTVVGVLKGTKFGMKDDSILGVGAHYDTVRTTKGKHNIWEHTNTWSLAFLAWYRYFNKKWWG
jgi:hypothetical protein